MHIDPFLNKCIHGLVGIIWRNGERINLACAKCNPKIGEPVTITETRSIIEQNAEIQKMRRSYRGR